MSVPRFDFVVIGSGPAGQLAATTAARDGRSVLIIERDRGVGGACVQRGTIPSKTLRETAAYYAGLKVRSCGAFDVSIPPHIQLQGLMSRMEKVVTSHTAVMSRELEELGVEQWHGRARFVGPHELEVQGVRGEPRRVTADYIIVATGSRPRTPPHAPVDHEHILDSDSLLGTMYVPESLTILGAGVIAAEYASIFASLGVKVVMVDRHALPIGFLDKELSSRFVSHFEGHEGCRFLGERGVLRVEWDGVSSVVAELDDGEKISSEKVFCALGRIANLEDLNLDAVGLAPTERGLLAVDENFRTQVDYIYAVGDVIGPPSLASCSKDQGQRAAFHALGKQAPCQSETIPIGIYTIPEISSVGLTEELAREQCEPVVGRASFAEVARGVIGGHSTGFVKLIAHPGDGRLLGAHVFGESATELIHVAQMVLLSGGGVDVFTKHVFNFPTLAEVYQVAARNIERQLEAVGSSAATARS